MRRCGSAGKQSLRICRRTTKKLKGVKIDGESAGYPREYGPLYLRRLLDLPGEGGFFCAKGKSEKPVPRKGCICGDCANFQQYGLRDGYDCWDGKAGEGPQ